MGMNEDDEHEEETTVVANRAELLGAVLAEAKRTKANLIVLKGPDAGQIFAVGRGGVIGRAEDVPIRVSDSECSRYHAKLYTRDGKIFVEDLGSTNGTYVNDEAVATAEINDGDQIQLGTTTILKFSYQDAIEEAFQKRMFESAMRDALTGAYNKRYFEERFASEFAYARRHGTPLCLIIIDVDHFKAFNDQHGHPIGDQVLVLFAERVMHAIRREDLFARYGGEEFVVLARGLEIEEGRLFAERIRGLIEDTIFPIEDKKFRVTASAGVAVLPYPEIIEPADLIAAADRALYRAKEAGRNRVCTCDDPSPG